MTVVHDKAVTAWAQARCAEIRTPSDVGALLAWQPYFFLPRIERADREARMPLSGGQITMVEVGLKDLSRKVLREHRMVVGLIEHPKLRFRAAIRSRRSGGWVDGVERGLQALDGAPLQALVPVPIPSVPQPSRYIRDPQFEAWFHVTGLYPEEVLAATPWSLRALLLECSFHGIIELRAGAALFTIFDAPRFEPASLDRALDLGARIVAALP